MEPAWYYVVNGNQVGPVSLDELRAVAAAGKLAPTDLVWQENTPDWVPAHTVAGLLPSAPPLPRSMPAVPPQPTYSVSPPPPPAAPFPLEPEPLPLDDDLGPARARRDRGAPGGAPDWANLIQVFVRRAFGPDPSQVKPEPAEDAALTRSGVMDATSRKLAVWRRSMLFVSAVPCAFAALFGLIDVIAMDQEEREPFSAFGMLLLYVQAFALFSLPVAAVFGALAYDRLAVSARWVLAGGLVSFAVPLAVAFVPADWLLDLKTDSRETVGAAEGRRAALGLLLGITFYIALMPAVLSLLPAVARACIRLKMLLPESLVPGWGLVTSTPLCVLLTLATFVLLYHVVGNALLIIGLLLWVGAPLLYLTRFGLLTRPVSSPADRTALANTSLGVLGLILLGMLFLMIFLFTAKVGGKTIMGFDEDKSLARPWSLDLHKTWIEYVGRSLFLSVFFADLVLRMALSIWREERAFAGSAQSAGYDRTMAGLDSAVLPRGGAPARTTAE
jgi:hypothetical protein